MKNFRGLENAKKTELKPLIAALRQSIYENDDIELLEEGLSINMGKRDEDRFTVKVQIVA